MKRILVADDERDIVESIGEMLSSYYTVDVATTGLEVVKLFECNTYDGLIIDVEFGPGVSGLEIASVVRAQNKEVRILIFSAVEYSNAVRQQAVDLGAFFCVKPLNLDFIRRVLEG